MLFTGFRKLVLLFIALTSVIVSLGFVPPDDPLEKIIKALKQWQNNYITESVYLQTDKPFYAAGDTLWFKSYVTLGSGHQLSGLSGVLNVDLVNISGKIESQIKLRLTGGAAWGDFALPDNLREGIYQLRAYTNYMRNAGEDAFFNKTVFIGNLTSSNVHVAVTDLPGVLNEKNSYAKRVEFIDAGGRPYVNKKVSYNVTNGVINISAGEKVTDASGGLKLLLPEGKPGNNKMLRIATKITISENSSISKDVFTKAGNSRPGIAFMPEGGNLITDIPARVAFKATGPNGLGLFMEGKLVDEANNVVAELKTSHLGMGIVKFTPLKGHIYKANLKDSLGNEYTVPLPKMLERGCVMMVNGSADEFKIHIMSNLTMAPDQHFLLVAQADGELYFAAKSNNEAEAFDIEIPKNRFPGGVVQFTIFSATGEPLCERLAFVRNETGPSFSITSDKKSYQSHEKVNLSVRPLGGGQNAGDGSFSVAVTSMALVNVDEQNESTIFTSLLLSSPLKGFIEKPNYYFSNITAKTEADLDLLMLTQGFRRFEWRRILNNDFPDNSYKPEKFLQISGMINYQHKAAAGAKVSIFKPQGSFFSKDTVTDDKGRFLFEDLLFTDTGKFVLRAATADGKRNVDIVLDTIPPPQYTLSTPSPQVVESSIFFSTYLKNDEDNLTEAVGRHAINKPILLKDVVIKERKINPYIKHSSNLNGPGNADQVITADQFTAAGGTLANALLTKIRFVNIINGKAINTRGNSPMAIVMDGTFVLENMMNSIPASNVASVEVLRDLGKTAIYGSRGANGIILITSKTGDIPEQIELLQKSPGVKPYSKLGYYLAREFYAPVYPVKGGDLKTPDRRSTIYWNPNLVADEHGNFNVDFYNADIKGLYKVVVEGINADGDLSREVFTYQVN